MDLYKLVGKYIKISYKVKDGTSGVIVHKHKWFVIAAYPHHVMAMRTFENGAQIRECFNIGTLITNGVLRIRRQTEGIE